MQKRGSLLSLFGFGAVVAGAAWFGSRYTPKDPKTKLWYERLEKPKYSPPHEVYPLVWTSLAALIAYSGWRTWLAESSARRSQALRLWAAQLVSNAEWTKLFFGQHRPQRALADALFLESVIIRYIVAAYEVDPVAALTFVPYAAWVAFATALNIEIALRNPDAEDKLPRAA
jgi:translocator protein